MPEESLLKKHVCLDGKNLYILKFPRSENYACDGVTLSLPDLVALRSTLDRKIKEANA